MKEVTLRIDDSAFEKFMGLVSLCPNVKVLKDGDCIDTMDAVDRCFASAIKEMAERKVFKSPADYAYVMEVTLEGAVTKNNLFVRTDDFISYLTLIGIEHVPGRSSVYTALGNMMGRYPLWTFADDPKQVEVLRRRNIAKQFLSAFFRYQRSLSDGISDK